MYDIEITNATIVDGLGSEAYEGNIYVKACSAVSDKKFERSCLFSS